MRKGEPKKDGSGNWPDKNFLAAAISPDHRDWHPVEQPAPFDANGGGTAAAPASAMPDSTPAGAAPIAPPKWAS
jgi:hypothetical protein